MLSKAIRHSTWHVFLYLPTAAKAAMNLTAHLQKIMTKWPDQKLDQKTWSNRPNPPGNLSISGPSQAVIGLSNQGPWGLPETNSEWKPLKVDGWKMNFLLGLGLFSGANWLLVLGLVHTTVWFSGPRLKAKTEMIGRVKTFHKIIQSHSVLEMQTCCASSHAYTQGLHLSSCFFRSYCIQREIVASTRIAFGGWIAGKNWYKHQSEASVSHCSATVSAIFLNPPRVWNLSPLTTKNRPGG